MLQQSVTNTLKDLVNLLGQLSNDQYANPCAALSNATIGEHTRHIVEMFQCLLRNYDSGIINYDNRERNILIQTDTHFALSAIGTIINNLNKIDKKLTLHQIIDDEEITIESNYNRELLYNLEHCVHHQALIKVAVLQCDDVVITEYFGVARSTIEYRKQCAQ